MHVRKSITSRITALASAGILVCAGWASAQTFESVHGGPQCSEAGRSVAVASQGGYISVGETFSQNCQNSDIFIVRSTDDGRQHWSAAYDIGGNDSATSIKETFFGPAGFIITGVTENQNDGKCKPSRDVFLLRINYCGEVLWVHTYGHEKTDEIGWEVVEAQDGDPAFNTSAGDFIIAGSTTYPNAGSDRNGYLVRANGNNGGLIWDTYYDGPDRKDDYFYSLDEAIEGLPSNATDIVAAGGSNSYGRDYQGWIVRVSANNGDFQGGSHNTATYGDEKFEEFRSIRELHISNAGDLVAVGTTTSLTGGNEVYAVETKPDPCDFIDDIVFGNFNSNYPSEGYAIREIPFNGPFYNAGELIVTGYIVDRSSAGRNEDVFLQVLKPSAFGGLALNNPMVQYGGSKTDWGWSVETVDPKKGEKCRSTGFIVVGFTESPEFIGGDPRQLYLIKTDENLADYCTDMLGKPESKKPGWAWKCEKLETPKIGEECTPPIKVWCMEWWCRLCHCRFHTEICELKDCKPCQPSKPECMEKWNDEVTEKCKEYGGGDKRLTESAAETETMEISLNSVPNPVKRGGELALKYTLLQDAAMTVTISDITGKTVNTSTLNGRAGAGSIAIATRGWASGVYLVSVKIGANTTATRVVVTE